MFLTNNNMQFDRDNCMPVFSSEFNVGDVWLDSCFHVRGLGLSDVGDPGCPGV